MPDDPTPQAGPKDGDQGTDPPTDGTKDPATLSIQGVTQDDANSTQADSKTGDDGGDQQPEPKNDKVLGLDPSSMHREESR